MNHVSIFVLNQDSAYELYVNKLGFTVHTDAPMGPGKRWLTVCPPEQPEMEISLMSIEEGMMFKKEYEELKSKGVEFSEPPTKEFYGYEALLKDDSGNWFSLGQKNKNMETRIELKHPAGKKAVRMDKVKYSHVRGAILNYLKMAGESTHTELWHGVAKEFKAKRLKFEGSVQWYTEWVKLDLEANRMLRRVPGSEPQKYTLAK